MARILFDQVWKRFRRGPAHDSLRDLIPAMTKRMLGRGPSREELGAADFWAVKDVSFEVKPGEALGIIGGNGAGKSTTLKLLTRILAPTRGTALIEGRFGSLIEVSAGFHLDLTGRENVFLQGAIMGMPQQLIKDRFDEIVEFSGVSAFIDTPVKRYSSGMNARLGFSIAVHLEPDVLIVDEVLSVGDAEFQGRAFGRIKQMVQGNIPVVIVSHQLERVAELCTKTILLRQGEVAARGDPAEVIRQYISSAVSMQSQTSDEVGGVVLESANLLGDPTVKSGSRAEFLIRGTAREGVPDWLDIVIEVRNAGTNTRLYTIRHREALVLSGLSGSFERRLTIDANLGMGRYSLELSLYDRRSGVRHHGPTVPFEVVSELPFRGQVQMSLRESVAP